MTIDEHAMGQHSVESRTLRYKALQSFAIVHLNARRHGRILFLHRIAQSVDKVVCWQSPLCCSNEGILNVGVRHDAFTHVDGIREPAIFGCEPVFSLCHQHQFLDLGHKGIVAWNIRIDQRIGLVILDCTSCTGVPAPIPSMRLLIWIGMCSSSTADNLICPQFR